MMWVANKAMKQMKDFLVEFGMTPSARSRIMVAKQEENESAYAAWKKKKAAQKK